MKLYVKTQVLSCPGAWAALVRSGQAGSHVRGLRPVCRLPEPTSAVAGRSKFWATILLTFPICIFLIFCTNFGQQWTTRHSKLCKTLMDPILSLSLSVSLSLQIKSHIYYSYRYIATQSNYAFPNPLEVFSFLCLCICLCVCLCHY